MKPKFLFWGLSLILFPLCIITSANAQSKRVMGSFLYLNEAYNYEFAQEDTHIYTFRISSINDEPDSANYAISEFSKDIFEKVFVNQMIAKYSHTDSVELKEKSLEIFYAIKTKFEFLDDEPVTSYLILKYDSVKSILKGNTSVRHNTSLSNLVTPHVVKRVAVETDDGVIKNIIVQLVDTLKATVLTQSPRKYLEFKNQFPISISGKFDAEKFAGINLYCFNCGGVNGLVRYFKLSDIVALDIVLENDKEDYSPAKGTFVLTPISPIVEMKKEKRSRIVDLSAFTDFVGMDQEQPNGLIQLEAKRKININTTYKLFLSGGTRSEDFADKIDFSTIKDTVKTINQNKAYTEYEVKIEQWEGNRSLNNTAKYKTDTIRVLNKNFTAIYYNVFGSIEPKLLFSKLEENNRFIDSTTLVDGKIDPLTNYQYQLASFGATLQVFKLSFSQLKFTWNVANVGAYWYRSKLSFSTDSTEAKSVALNSHYWLLGTNLNFKPDSRWGVTLGFDYIKQYLWNKDYQLANSHALLQPYIDAFIKTDLASKLFFRFRWTFEDQNLRNNFVQIQLGYSLTLFGGNPSAPSTN